MHAIDGGIPTRRPYGDRLALMQQLITHLEDIGATKEDLFRCVLCCVVVVLIAAVKVVVLFLFLFLFLFLLPFFCFLCFRSATGGQG